MKRKTANLVNAFEHAARNYEVIGAMPLEDWPEIKRNYRNTKKALRDYITELERWEFKADYSEI